MVKYRVSVLKKVISVIILSLYLFASVQDIEQKIYNEIFSSIYKNKKIVKIWVDDGDNFHNLKKRRFIFVENPKQADILILNHYVDIDIDRPIFVRKYYLTKKYKDRVIGGFYWQKGRANIIFIKRNLSKYGIELPKNFSMYIQESR